MTQPAHDFLLPTVLILATILLVFGMRYVSAGLQGRRRLAGDVAVQVLAEKATTSQAAMAESLASAKADLADVKARLGSIETMLRDVG